MNEHTDSHSQSNNHTSSGNSMNATGRRQR